MPSEKIQRLAAKQQQPEFDTIDKGNQAKWKKGMPKISTRTVGKLKMYAELLTVLDRVARYPRCMSPAYFRLES